MTATTMRSIQHRIGGLETPGASTRTAPVWDPATGTQQAEVVLADAAMSTPQSRPPRPRLRPGARSSVVRRARIMFAFRDLVERNLDEITRIISTEHGKILDDAKGEVIRGMEVVEFACGIPQLLKGEFSEQVSTDVDAYSFRQPLGVVRRHHAVQLPDHGADVDAPGRDRLPEHLRAQALRARPVASRTSSPSCTPRPACRTASSTSCTATRWPSTRCSTTPTSRRLVRRLDADRRYVHERATATGKRVQALGGAKNHAVVMPDADLDFAADHLIAAGYGSAGQRCMAISAVVAVGDAADALVERLAARRRGAQGRPGPRARRRDGPGRHRRGARPDRRLHRPGEATAPTLVVDGRELEVEGTRTASSSARRSSTTSATDMTIYTDEIFGPVLVVSASTRSTRRSRWSTTNPYGNGTAIFTSSGHAARAFQREVEVGMIGVNVPSRCRWPSTPSAAGRTRCSATTTSTARKASASTRAPRRSPRAGPRTGPAPPPALPDLQLVRRAALLFILAAAAAPGSAQAATPTCAGPPPATTRLAAPVTYEVSCFDVEEDQIAIRLVSVENGTALVMDRGDGTAQVTYTPAAAGRGIVTVAGTELPGNVTGAPSARDITVTPNARPACPARPVVHLPPGGTAEVPSGVHGRRRVRRPRLRGPDRPAVRDGGARRGRCRAVQGGARLRGLGSLHAACHGRCAERGSPAHRARGRRAGLRSRDAGTDDDDGGDAHAVLHHARGGRSRCRS